MPVTNTLSPGSKYRSPHVRLAPIFALGLPVRQACRVPYQREWRCEY